MRHEAAVLQKRTATGRRGTLDTTAKRTRVGAGNRCRSASKTTQEGRRKETLPHVTQ